MVAKRRPGHPSREPYKVTVALYPAEWDALRIEAKSRGITGGELVSIILSGWVGAEDPSDAAPIPDAAPEDA